MDEHEQAGLIVDAALPVGLLLAAEAAVDLGLPWWARVLPAGLLVGGFVERLARRRRGAWSWGAAVVPGLRPTWALIPAPRGAVGLESCADPLSPVAVWRAAEAAVLLGGVGIVAGLLRVAPAEIGLRWPSRRAAALSAVAPGAIAPLALVGGPVLARPFFGSFALELGRPRALVPATMLAVSNGALEEVLYRGGLMHWTAMVTGPVAALWIQAAAFGLAHGGTDYVASPVPVMAALVLAGAVAGLVARRTGSLLLPIAVHAAADVPLYYYQACRLA